MADFIAGLRGGPALNLIHIEKPHYPWTHFPDGRKYSNLSSEFRDVFEDGTRWGGGRSLTDLALQRHLLESGFTDGLLGEMIAGLKRKGLWKKAIVIVTADHGNAVIGGVPRRNPTAANIGQIAPVPLFVKAAGQTRGRVVDRHLCTTDILPMLARMLSIDYPWLRQPCPTRTVTVANSPEGETTRPLADVERLSDRYIARIGRMFGFGGGWAPVLRFRPNDELIGRPVGSLPSAPAGSASAGLDEQERLRDVAPGAEVVLASLIRGQLEGAEARTPLAAAVNGRVAAVGSSFRVDDEVRYSLLAPPESFERGANRVAIYRVLGSAPATRLQRLGP